MWLGAQDYIQPVEIKQIVSNLTSQVKNLIKFFIKIILFFNNYF